MAKVKVNACKCDRCEHIWLGRIKDPVCCPKCKSAYWDRGKKVVTKSNVKDPRPTVELIRRGIKPHTIKFNGEPQPTTEEITPKRKPTKDEQKAFDCAFAMKFNCNFYATHTEHFEYCKHCFNAPFWELKDRYLIAMNNKVENKTVEIDKDKWKESYKNCSEFSIQNGVPNCYIRNTARTNNDFKYNYCRKCIEDIDKWGKWAAGYKERIKEDKDKIANDFEESEGKLKV